MLPRAMHGGGPVRFGDFLFDSGARQLTRQGESIHLSPKAFHLLHILLARAPHAVSKKDLLEAIWPDVHVEEANLKNLVVEVRAALRSAGDSGKWVRTVHRFGYAFAAPFSSGPAGAALVSGGAVHPLREGENLIGRNADCFVVLIGSGISRHHSLIILSGDGATIRDCGSRNGTLVNGETIGGTTALHHGDTIRLGVITLIFHRTKVSDTTALPR